MKPSNSDMELFSRIAKLSYKSSCSRAGKDYPLFLHDHRSRAVKFLTWQARDMLEAAESIEGLLFSYVTLNVHYLVFSAGFTSCVSMYFHFLTKTVSLTS